jgi:thymidylate kinase
MDQERAATTGRHRPSRGGVLAVGGPDGVGKTTLCDALVSGVLADVAVLRARSVGVLPRRDPIERRAIRLGAGVEPDLSRLRVYPPPYPWLKAQVKVLYGWVDALLGWVFRVRPFVRRGGWVVLERGWWDQAADPRRYRLPPPARLVRALGRTLPRADLVIALAAPPEMIRERRPELTTAELERQMTAWREILPADQPVLHLDTSAPPEDVVAKASEALAAASAGRRGRLAWRPRA